MYLAIELFLNEPRQHKAIWENSQILLWRDTSAYTRTAFIKLLLDGK